MKVNMIKQRGGLLIPADDLEEERLTKFKTGEIYSVDIKLGRSPAFHGKMFVFFNFCFQYWKSDRVFANEQTQKEEFRKDLTIQAGFYDEVWNLRGELKVVAKSLAYHNMLPEEFEACYNANIQAAMNSIFDSDDYDIYNRLMSFF